MKSSQKSMLTLVLALGWWVIIWILSSLPSQDFPQIEALSWDKAAHAGVYFILGLLLNVWMKQKNYPLGTRSLLYSLLLVSALFDELHQDFIPGRSVSIYDFCANGTGLFLAWFWALITNDKRRKP